MTKPHDATGKPAHRCLSEAEVTELEATVAGFAYMHPDPRVFDAIFAKLRRWVGQSWGDVVEIEIRLLPPNTAQDDAVFGVPFKIRANVYGEWAAHRGIEDKDTMASWSSVTHMPTGRNLPHIRPTGDQAKAIAATLAGRVPHLATADDVEQSRHLIIPAVRLVIPNAYPGARF